MASVRDAVMEEEDAFCVTDFPATSLATNPNSARFMFLALVPLPIAFPYKGNQLIAKCACWSEPKGIYR